MPDDGGDARIIFAGGITPQWMHETVLKALEKVPECRYTSAARWGRRTFPAWRHCLAGRRQCYPGSDPPRRSGEADGALPGGSRAAAPGKEYQRAQRHHGQHQDL